MTFNGARLPTAPSLAALLILSVAAYTSKTYAGPPLIILDPGVLEPGQWEVITAVSSAAIGEDQFYTVPLLDVSLGLISERLQIAVTYPHVYADTKDNDANWEFDNLELGATWRFWQNERWQLALAPIYAFGVTRRTADQGIGSVGDIATLPLVAEYQINASWRVNTSVGYERVESADDLWSYNAALAHTFNERWELLAELAGARNDDTGKDALDVRAGFDYALAPDFHLLVAVATGLRETDPAEKLDYELFVGLQFTF
ncbi:hypothetical protein EYC98_06205 [Halieaceae bacterium IMCC14734]|uniref:Transporter n=1 Tax=Candidatus Litorirhabdus singularis TaxID=2518993 RepID=A0ABT3TF71_9GAMM|nr:hypothetical protein [Candidatus Litorirhabdus singularis]MCX2980465.1 hypothetical protein [Candidatus Litorirhabdus singularis]